MAAAAGARSATIQPLNPVLLSLLDTDVTELATQLALHSELLFKRVGLEELEGEWTRLGFSAFSISLF